MKFNIKSNVKECPKGYEQVDVNVGQLAVGLGVGTYLLSMGGIPYVSAGCKIVSGSLIAIGSLPFGVLAGGLILGTVTAILVDEMLQDLRDNKQEIKEEVEDYTFKTIEQIKYESSLALSKKEDK